MSLMPVEEALVRILTSATQLEPEHVPLHQAHGRVLACSLSAFRDQPPFSTSSMDGYAVRASDAGTAGNTLTVVGRSVAGKRYEGTVSGGEAVRIFTGAPLPDGADAILIQENAETDGDRLTVLDAVEPGRFVRPMGLDFRSGDRLLDAGRKLDPIAVALAASMNHASVPVVRRPRIAVLANGDELVEAGALPGPDQIIASNTHALIGIVTAAGEPAIDRVIARDNRSDMTTRIGDLADVDVLVTLGGASVGDHDIVQDVLADIGMALNFWRIAMRPGKPLMFGEIGRTRVLGLPGNPVSSIVCARVFLVPLIGALLGATSNTTDPVPAVLSAPLPENDRRQDYLRAIAAPTPDGLTVKAFDRQDSSMLATLAHANALIVRAPFAPAAQTGDRVGLLLLT